MMDEAVGEPTPHSPIRPMISLETANTPITPPPQMTGAASEAPPSGGPPPSLATAASFVTTYTPIPILNSITPPLFPNDGRRNPPTLPPITLFFPNNAGFSFLPLPMHTINEQRKTTIITPSLNGMPSLTPTTPANNTANGPSVILQA
ncbi:unnamed protein product [Lactuca virosa]|uniref:Uncharacterized protein n=1 Tax=Lactuca virosa TaxID=75947 RepID=A0AAU9NLJ3_9ASTR|nr:unnamed protein product [Lactuca virosa]